MAENYTPEERAKKIMDRRTASMDYWKPIHDEIVEVRQALKCKVDPIYKKNADGSNSTEEDKSRTNVASPILSIMARKNVARLTANAPEIDYISSTNQQIGDKLSSWGRMQYDLTNESEVIRKHVMQAEAFGFSAVKLFHNDVVVRRPMRVRTQNANREQILRARGASDSHIDDQVAQYGPDLTPPEKIAAQAEFGSEFTYESVTTKYSGPTTKFIFIGDLHLPPGAKSLDSADWLIEDFEDSANWFDFWMGKTYKDPETGLDVPILNEDAVKKVVDGDDSFSQSDRQTIRERFRAISRLDNDQATVQGKKLSCRKNFQFHECHERTEDGTQWISWVVKDQEVGRMPYVYDLNGDWQYTDLVFFPDLVDAYGDSTPRLCRYIHKLFNQNLNARTDFVNNRLRPFTLTRAGADVPDEAIQRSWGQELVVQNIDRDVKVEQMPPVPPEAWEQEASLLRLAAMAEPAMASADLAGTNASPQTGKTATVGVLAQRERDALLQFKIDGLNIFWKKHQQKKLWMLQQTLADAITIPQQYLPANGPVQNMDGGAAQPIALSMGSGEVKTIRLDWEEIQGDIDVQPRAGSTLSKEDEFHAMRAQQFFTMAAQSPDVFNKWYAGQVLAATIKDVDVQKAVRPEPPPETPLPKIQGNLNFPMEKIAQIAPDVFNELMQMFGLPASEDVKHNALLDGIVKMGDAADAAGKLAEPVNDGSTNGLRKTGADRVGGAGNSPSASGPQG